MAKSGTVIGLYIQTHRFNDSPYADEGDLYYQTIGFHRVVARICGGRYLVRKLWGIVMRCWETEPRIIGVGGDLEEMELGRDREEYFDFTWHDEPLDLDTAMALFKGEMDARDKDAVKVAAEKHTRRRKQR